MGIADMDHYHCLSWCTWLVSIANQVAMWQFHIGRKVYDMDNSNSWHWYDMALDFTESNVTPSYWR